MECRTCVIFNPHANRGAAASLLPQVERCLALHGQAELVQTTRPGEAVEQAARVLEGGYEMSVAAGGDGTVNEIINGCLSHPRRLTVVA